MESYREPQLLRILVRLLKERENPSVAFLCGGSRRSGLGHVYRSLFIASDLRERGIRVSFGSGRRGADMVIIDLPDEVDPATEMSSLSSDSIRVLFDNRGDFREKVDVLIYPDFLPLESAGAKATYIFSGWDYVYPPKNIRLLKGEAVEDIDILIAFGGSDPRSYTRRAVESLIKRTSSFGLNFHVVFGPLNPDYNLFEKRDLPSNLRLYRSLRDLSPLYRISSAVVSSGGLTFAYSVFLEKITVGVPQNDREMARIRYYSSKYSFVDFASSPEEAIQKVVKALEGNKPRRC
ncbi:MAG: hypothetical protein J7M13_06725 [Synergistetes bacterium]|nr:hypothetical protein [Synergistota bacterium]